MTAEEQMQSSAQEIEKQCISYNGLAFSLLSQKNEVTPDSREP